MMHCSYELNQVGIAKKASIKHRAEDHCNDLLAGDFFNHLLKKNLPICFGCPFRKRSPFSFMGNEVLFSIQ